MKHIKKIKIDIDKKSLETIPSVQYDSNTRFLHISLVNNSLPLDLTGCSVKIAAIKPDDTVIFNNCTIVDAKQGLVEAELTEQINAVPGQVECELKIYTANGVLTTKTLDINVTASTTESKVITSTNEFKALTDALKIVQGIDNKAEKVDVKAGFDSVNLTIYNQGESIDQRFSDVKKNFDFVKDQINKLDKRLGILVFIQETVPPTAKEGSTWKQIIGRG